MSTNTEDKKRKRNKNAFFHFMVDWRKEQEEKGRKFPRGLCDVMNDPLCSSAWQALTVEEKKLYKQKTVPNEDRLTCTGESISKLQEMKDESLNSRSVIEERIRTVIQFAMRYNSLQYQNFLFIHVNCLYYNDTTDDYNVVEIAVADFSFHNGVTRFYHRIINTTVALGYRRIAIEQATKSHNVFWDAPTGIDDWRLISGEFIQFIESSNMIRPILYTADNTALAVNAFIKKINYTPSNDSVVIDLQVGSIELLLAYMLMTREEKIMDMNLTRAMARSIFAKGFFNANFYEDSCLYHKIQSDGQMYCSLCVVRQWAYLLCDYCADYLKIERKEGVHYPFRTTDTTTTSINKMDEIKIIEYTRPTVWSATGVSQKHREDVSERSRKQNVRAEDIERTAGLKGAEIKQQLHFGESQFHFFHEGKICSAEDEPATDDKRDLTRSEECPEKSMSDDIQQKLSSMQIDEEATTRRDDELLTAYSQSNFHDGTEDASRDILDEDYPERFYTDPKSWPTPPNESKLSYNLAPNTCTADLYIPVTTDDELLTAHSQSHCHDGTEDASRDILDEDYPERFYTDPQSWPMPPNESKLSYNPAPNTCTADSYIPVTTERFDDRTAWCDYHRNNNSGIISNNYSSTTATGNQQQQQQHHHHHYYYYSNNFRHPHEQPQIVHSYNNGNSSCYYQPYYERPYEQWQHQQQHIYSGTCVCYTQRQPPMCSQMHQCNSNATLMPTCQFNHQIYSGQMLSYHPPPVLPAVPRWHQPLSTTMPSTTKNDWLFNNQAQSSARGRGIRRKVI